MLKKILLGILALVAILVVAGVGVGWWLSSPTSNAEHARMEASPHFHDGAFANPERQSSWEFGWQQIADMFAGNEAQVTPPGIIPVDTPDPTFLDAKPKPGLRAMWFGHSSVLIEIDGLRVMVDPVLSQRASPFAAVGPSRFHPSPIPLSVMRGIDAVLISHNHYDHMDEATIRHLARQGTKIFVPLGMAPLLAKWGIPADQGRSFAWWEKISIGEVELTATPARHYSSRGTFDYKKTFWLSWSVVGPEHRVFYSGDTGYSKSYTEIGKQLGPFDLGIIKVGAYGPGQAWLDVHMHPEDAMTTAKDIGAKLVLPVHWATFNLAYHAWDEPIERALVSAEKKGVRVTTPRPGEWIGVDGLVPMANWWRDLAK